MSRLPDKESDRGQEIMHRYIGGERQSLADELKYPNQASFTRAMRQVYGVKVGMNNTGWEPTGINIPLKLDTTSEIRTAAILNDTHNPYHDAACVSLVETFLQTIDLHYLIYNGDMNDFYQLSKFNKNPQRISNLQKDLDSTKYMLDRHNRLFPNAEKKFIAGNHENRLQAYMWNQAKELSSLEGTKLPQLFGLKELGIDFIDYEQGLMCNDDFLILHGNLVSVHSSYTAKRMFEKHGGNGMCGHTHRGGVFYKRDRFGTHGWWENFCVEPNSLVLKSDLTWVPIKNLSVGDSVVGFDEFPDTPRTRKLRNTTVDGLKYVNLPSYLITLEDGREIIASEEHMWLGSYQRSRRYFKAGWIQTKQLRPGRLLRQIGLPWEMGDDYDTGYLAGMLDGEGFAYGFSPSKAQVNVGVSQNRNEAYSKTKELWDKLNIGSREYISKSGCVTLKATGLSHALRILGTTRPPRLMDKVSLEGRGLPGIRSTIKVASIKHVGVRRLVSIETGTRTLFINGLASHNCLCHLNPDWVKHPNWQQGFSLVHFKGKRFHVEPIPIIEHTIMYGGRLYK